MHFLAYMTNDRIKGTIGVLREEFAAIWHACFIAACDNIAEAEYPVRKIVEAAGKYLRVEDSEVKRAMEYGYFDESIERKDASFAFLSLFFNNNYAIHKWGGCTAKAAGGDRDRAIKDTAALAILFAAMATPPANEDDDTEFEFSVLVKSILVRANVVKTPE